MKWCQQPVVVRRGGGNEKNAAFASHASLAELGANTIFPPRGLTFIPYARFSARLPAVGESEPPV